MAGNKTRIKDKGAITAAQLAANDVFVVEDVSANAVKKITKEEMATAFGGGGGSDAAAIHDDTAGEINAITEKVTLADADEFLIEDSAASYAKKKTLWSTIKSVFKTYYDSVAATLTQKTIDADNNTITNIGTSELSDEGVTLAKMAHIDTNQILGRATAGTGDVEALTATQVRTIINVEDGAEVNTVDSVNSQTGAVVLDADDISDAATTNKFTTAADISKLAGIEAGADVTDAANVISALNGAAITVGVVATTDKLLWQDADDSDALKYSTVQDILDLGGGGLTNFTESAGTATGGDTYAALTPTSNDFVILVPNNNGGFSLAIADGTATGGNDRGNKSIDLQLYRTAAAQVASGLGSSIVGGGVNTASGQYSVAGGFGCAASGDYTVVMGSSNTVSTANSVAIGSGISITGAATSSVAFGQDIGVQIPNAVALGTKVSARMSAALNIGTYAKWSSSQGKVAQYIAVMTAEADNASSGSEVLSNYQNNAAYYRQINLFASDSSLTATFDVCVRAKTTAGAYTAGETYHFKQSVTAKNVGGTGSIVSTGTAFDKHGDASLVSLDPQLSFSIVAIGGINTVQVSITTTADTNLYVNASAIITYLTP